MISNNDFEHKGLRDFWDSSGRNKSGINPAHASILKLILVHLDSAHNLQDILGGLGKLKNAKQLNGGRYSIEVNGNWRVTFTFDSNTNRISQIYLEDYHRSGGAKQF